MQIYLARNNVQAGPYTLEQVNTMLASGEVLLPDLAWHEGLDGWKSLDEMTNGQSFYDPNGDLTKLQDIFNQAVDEATKGKDKKSKIIVVDAKSKGAKTGKDKPEQDKNRLTVDQLYGRKPTSDTSNIDSETGSNKNNDKKANKKPNTKVIRVQVGQNLKIDDDILASPTQRIIASLIDWLTIVMICLPIFMRVNMDKFNEVSASAMTMAEKMAASQELAQQVPPHIALMCNLLFLGFIVIQSILLIRKGQTLGKLVMGIRVLDFKSHRLASPTKVLLLRSIVTNFAYMTFPLFIVFDSIYMLMNRNRRSLHDKLAGTYVAKALDEQLELQEKNKTP